MQEVVMASGHPSTGAQRIAPTPRTAFTWPPVSVTDESSSRPGCCLGHRPLQVGRAPLLEHLPGLSHRVRLVQIDDYPEDVIDRHGSAHSSAVEWPAADLEEALAQGQIGPAGGQVRGTRQRHNRLIEAGLVQQAIHSVSCLVETMRSALTGAWRGPLGAEASHIISMGARSRLSWRTASIVATRRSPKGSACLPDYGRLGKEETNMRSDRPQE